MKTALSNTILLISMIILGVTFYFNLDGVTAAVENATMTVEVNLLGFGEIGTEGIGIEVQDFISFGNLTKNDMISEELTLKINNTGSVPITVTPQLKDSNEDIFSYLFFRTQKSTSTNNTDLIKFYKIGNFNFDIDKPATGSRARSKSIYMQLNLTDYPDKIDKDILSHRAEIIFYAMAQ